MVAVVVICLLRPRLDGGPVRSDWAGRLRVLPDLVPPIVIFLVVVGSIYAGIATPTEAALLGVVASLALAAWTRRPSIAMLRVHHEGQMRKHPMVRLFTVAAEFLIIELGKG